MSIKLLPWVQKFDRLREELFYNFLSIHGSVYLMKEDKGMDEKTIGHLGGILNMLDSWSDQRHHDKNNSTKWSTIS